MTFRNRKLSESIPALSWQHVTTLGLILCSSSCQTVDRFSWRSTAAKAPVVAADSNAQEATATVAGKQESSEAQLSKTAALPESESVAHKPAFAQAFELPMGRAFTKATGTEDSTAAASKTARTVDPFAEFENSQVKQVSAEYVLDVPELTKTASSTELASAQLDSTAFPETADDGQFDSYDARTIVSEYAKKAPPFPILPESEDEYIRDGGDRGHPVHYMGQDRTGLEVQDTVVEFRNSHGEFQVKATNEALVYAPRFGEVRTATLPQEGLSITKLSGHQDMQNLGSMDAKQSITEQVQRDELKGLRSRSRVSGLENLEGNASLNKDVSAKNHVKQVNVYEDLAFIQEGHFEKVSAANLAEAQAAAIEWSDGRQAIIIAQDMTGSLVQARVVVEEFTGVEDRRPDGELEIIKVADKAFAHPGDIITFTIRFDNIGGKDLGHIRVVDNLSPRLEYMEGSIESNRDGQVDVQDNIQGGKLLTFEFDEILKGKTGGFVTFKCRVR